MIAYVLDASALIALLREEPGADMVADRLVDSAISLVNLSEVVALFARTGASAAAIRDVLDPLPLARLPLDEPIAYAAGLLAPVTRPAGLSLGDRVCLATARHLGVPTLTGDRAWLSIADRAGVQVVAIR